MRSSKVGCSSPIHRRSSKEVGEGQRPLCPGSVIAPPSCAREFEAELSVDQVVLAFARAGPADANCEQRPLSYEANDEFWIIGIVESCCAEVYDALSLS